MRKEKVKEGWRRKGKVAWRKRKNTGGRKKKKTWKRSEELWRRDGGRRGEGGRNRLND